MPMRAPQILKAVRALIESPDRWTRDAFARDRAGKRIDPRKPFATCFCIIGAWRRAARHAPAHERVSALRALERATPNLLMPETYNDTAEHRDVLALLDRAIASMEASLHG